MPWGDGECRFPHPPPPPLAPGITPSESSGFEYVIRQISGAALVIIGVGITVAGLHGLKIYDAGGSVRRCNKQCRWYGSLTVWAFGQFLQLLGVYLAAEPVVAAFSTTSAILSNAWLSWKLQGEKQTPIDFVAMAIMILGAIFVGLSCPPAPNRSLSLEDYWTLFESPVPWVGLVATTFIAAAAVPRALQTIFYPQSEEKLGCFGLLQIGPSGGVAMGLMAGYTGGTAITATKLFFVRAPTPPHACTHAHNIFSRSSLFCCACAHAAPLRPLLLPRVHPLLSRMDPRIYYRWRRDRDGPLCRHRHGAAREYGRGRHLLRLYDAISVDTGIMRLPYVGFLHPGDGVRV